jgi:hypothetical protein
LASLVGKVSPGDICYSYNSLRGSEFAADVVYDITRKAFEHDHGRVRTVSILTIGKVNNFVIHHFGSSANDGTQGALGYLSVDPEAGIVLFSRVSHPDIATSVSVVGIAGDVGCGQLLLEEGVILDLFHLVIIINTD